jgi:cytoskeletal protein CcmA (bactofilin family)
MWEKKKLELPPQAGPSPSIRPPAAIPVAPAAVQPPPASGSAIGAAISIVGDIYSEEDLYIDGEVQGRLDTKNSRITVGPNARARSNVTAREVIILGSVQGDVEASQKITIRKQGSLVGNIKTAGIVIDDEAYFKGSIDIVRKPAEPAKAQPATPNPQPRTALG